MLPHLLQLGGQAHVLVAVALGLLFGPDLVLVGADPGVDDLNIPDAVLQFVCGFIHQIQRGFPRDVAVLADSGVFLLQVVQLPPQLLLLPLQPGGPLPLALVLAVAGQDVLLALDQLQGRHRFRRGVRIAGQLLGVQLLLLSNPANGPALVVQLLFPPLQCRQLLLYADDLQKCGRLFPAAGLHEPRHVQSQLLHKGVEQLLPGPAAMGVGDLQVAVLAGPLHRHTIREGQFFHWREDGAVPLGLRTTVTVPAQRPDDCVQRGGLALVVAAPDHRQAGGGRGERQGLDALDVLRFKLRDFY